MNKERIYMIFAIALGIIYGIDFGFGISSYIHGSSCPICDGVLIAFSLFMFVFVVYIIYGKVKR